MNKFSTMVFSAIAFALGLSSKEATAGPLIPQDCRPEPVIQDLLDLVNAAGNPLDLLTRENAAQTWLVRELDAKKIIKPIPVASVRDSSVPARNRQIPIRIYNPKPSAKNLPILVYMHGGGWTLGSLAAYDNIARGLSSKIGAIVVTVDYRLAPEHPFPAGMEDARLAFEWVLRNATELGGDPKKIGLAGDSGGATLATVIARKTAEAGFPVKLQALFYPATNLAAMDTPSYAANGKGYLLTKKSVETFRSLYVPNEADWKTPEVSPLLSTDAQLAKLPPTYLMALGCDPLRDEGLSYAEKLRANGVRVFSILHNRLVHGFLGYFNNALAPKASPFAERALDDFAAWARKEFTR